MTIEYRRGDGFSYNVPSTNDGEYRGIVRATVKGAASAASAASELLAAVPTHPRNASMVARGESATFLGMHDCETGVYSAEIQYNKPALNHKQQDTGVSEAPTVDLIRFEESPVYVHSFLAATEFYSVTQSAIGTDLASSKQKYVNKIGMTTVTNAQYWTLREAVGTHYLVHDLEVEVPWITPSPIYSWAWPLSGRVNSNDFTIGGVTFPAGHLMGGNMITVTKLNSAGAIRYHNLLKFRARSSGFFAEEDHKEETTAKPSTVTETDTGTWKIKIVEGPPRTTFTVPPVARVAP